MDKKEQAEKVANQAEEKVAALPAESPEKAGDYLAGLLSQAENAYTMYEQAQKEVAKGYKKQEQQTEKAYKDAEMRTNEALGRALDKARMVREQDEQQAEEEFRGALARAEEGYQRSAAEAARAHKKALEQAWHKRSNAREEAWSVFQGEKVTK